MSLYSVNLCQPTVFACLYLVVGDGRHEFFGSGVGDDRAQRDEVRNDRDDVDDVHQRPEECHVIGCSREPYRHLRREPDHTDRLDHEQRLVEPVVYSGCSYLFTDVKR